MIPVDLIIKLVLGLIIFLVSLGGVIWFFSVLKQNKKLKIVVKEEMKLRQESQKDTESIIDYMQQSNDIKKVQNEHLKKFQGAKHDEKHKIVNDLLNSLYSNL